jgi:hypothetical protein
MDTDVVHKPQITKSPNQQSLMQEQNRDVARKLGIATGAMFTFPLIVYFACFHFVFAHKDFPEAWAGIMAVIAANVVIAAYVWSAFSEPDDDFDGGKKDDNDAAAPRVGVHKLRTD